MAASKPAESAPGKLILYILLLILFWFVCIAVDYRSTLRKSVTVDTPPPPVPSTAASTDEEPPRAYALPTRRVSLGGSGGGDASPAPPVLTKNIIVYILYDDDEFKKYTHIRACKIGSWCRKKAIFFYCREKTFLVWWKTDEISRPRSTSRADCGAGERSQYRLGTQ